MCTHSPISEWKLFVTLKSVSGEELKLAQVVEGVAKLIGRVETELDVNISISNEASRFGKLCSLCTYCSYIHY